MEFLAPQPLTLSTRRVILLPVMRSATVAEDCDVCHVSGKTMSRFVTNVTCLKIDKKTRRNKALVSSRDI